MSAFRYGSPPVYEVGILVAGLLLIAFAIFSFFQAVHWSSAATLTAAQASAMAAGQLVLFEGDLRTAAPPTAPGNFVAYTVGHENGKQWKTDDDVTPQLIVEACPSKTNSAVFEALQSSGCIQLTVTAGYAISGPAIYWDEGYTRHRAEGIRQGEHVTVAGHLISKPLVIDADEVKGGTVAGYRLGWWASAIIAGILGLVLTAIGGAALLISFPSRKSSSQP
ncbi:MAG: hypothetical protein HGA45_14705 [Chloroflexales bacterium]|nr:hypothetical protein [Chloroflexales bacterium]